MTSPAPQTSLDTLATQQTTAASGLLDRDPTTFPQWPWTGVHDLVGPMLPGDLWVVGARPGNGKTTFCLNALDNFVQHSLQSLPVPVLYLGTEMEPALLRLQWAAWTLGLPLHLVLEGRWDALAPTAQDDLRDVLRRQALAPYRRYSLFAPVRRMTPEAVKKWVEYAVRHDCRALILDHIHRLDTGGPQANIRLVIGEAIAALKELAVQHGLVAVVAAQLNRPERTPLADLVPPPMSALKESGKLEEECDVGLLLHRPRKVGLDSSVVARVMKGEAPVTEVLEPDTMCVRVGKHRRRGHLLDQAAFLHVGRDGRLTDRAPTWQVAPPDVEERYGL